MDCVQWMLNAQTRIQAETDFKQILIDLGTYTFTVGLNQSQSFEIVKKFVEISENLMKVFSKFLPIDRVNFINGIIGRAGKTILPYQSAYITSLTTQNESFVAQEKFLGTKANPVNGKTESFSLQKFSIRSILTSYLQNQLNLNEIIKYKKELETKSSIENMVQTEYWKFLYADTTDTMYLYITDYYDGFQPFQQ